MQMSITNGAVLTRRATTGHLPGRSFYPVPADIARRSDLTATAKLVYAYLTFRQGKNQDAWPGQLRIATDCGVSRGTVISAICQLKQLGLLEVRRPPPACGNRTNRYRVSKMKCTKTEHVQESNQSRNGTSTSSNLIHGVVTNEHTNRTSEQNDAREQAREPTHQHNSKARDDRKRPKRSTAGGRCDPNEKFRDLLP